MSTVVVPPIIPPTVPPTNPPVEKLEKLEDIQGDIWSKGFPKDNETYYLFQIKHPADFARCLRKLVTDQPHLIPNLNMVKVNWAEIKAEKKRADAHKEQPKRLPMANALIAFTYKGLEIIRGGLQNPDDLLLEDIEKTDPAFSHGMKSAPLNDPTAGLDPLFADPTAIHGLLKVAGSSKEKVNERLKEIQVALQCDKGVINDVPGGTEGRIDGAVREGDNRGKEHFGFQDGISQPLMNGLDDPPPAPDSGALATSTMETEPKFLIVMEGTRSQGSNDIPRPDWMHQGSFLVFRKLEQNVEAFNDLTEKNFKRYECRNAEHMGAKLMGRWRSGAPITLPAYHTADDPTGDHCKSKKMNNFGYEKVDDNSTARGCPLAAHIRKTNPRRTDEEDTNASDPGLKFTRIIRGGIPYGPDHTKGEKPGVMKRGLLFACYQGSIEDGFQHMQSSWCNTDTFPMGGSGLDPIVGQGKSPDDMKMLITEGKEQVQINPPLVTFRGGEYFFVPSIKSLKGVLTAAAPLH